MGNAYFVQDSHFIRDHFVFFDLPWRNCSNNAEWWILFTTYDFGSTVWDPGHPSVLRSNISPRRRRDGETLT
jgi:hypothetical protein